MVSESKRTTRTATSTSAMPIPELSATTSPIPVFSQQRNASPLKPSSQLKCHRKAIQRQESYPTYPVEMVSKRATVTGRAATSTSATPTSIPKRSATTTSPIPVFSQQRNASPSNPSSQVPSRSNSTWSSPNSSDPDTPLLRTPTPLPRPRQRRRQRQTLWMSIIRRFKALNRRPCYEELSHLAWYRVVMHHVKKNTNLLV